MTNIKGVPDLSDWPQNELEPIDKCPACSATTGAPLYHDLTDRTFYCAPGKWKLYQCPECRTAYLNPRPTSASIGLAYTTYYTHSVVGENEVKEVTRVNQTKHRLQHGYINRRYKVGFPDAFALGSFLVPFLPVQRSKADRVVRMLTKPKGGGRVLDIGCGSGDYLLLMQRLGWKVTGLDFDPAAVAACQSKGLEVFQGTLEEADLAENSFDAITLSHVIEHVPDPLSTLKACFRLLKPGGEIYLETPNIDSAGHANFRENWRGLEVPRHLTIFTPSSLAYTCQQAGFSVRRTGGIAATFFLYEQSKAIEAGRRLNTQQEWVPIPPEMFRQLKQEEVAGIRHPEKAGIFGMLAVKAPQNKI